MLGNRELQSAPPWPGNPGLPAGPDDSQPPLPSAPPHGPTEGLAAWPVSSHTPSHCPIDQRPERRVWQEAWLSGKGPIPQLPPPLPGGLCLVLNHRTADRKGQGQRVSIWPSWHPAQCTLS